ncbi:Diguanylate cyclase (GGDEF) domain-containing protein [Paraburkholderia dioscoreae]|uniref:Diguanylate cyclase (GGDEF) domain-containing protein n=2 Tax=Burkholderiaceae TaxID=119060 RepID=A0A5Q4ZMG6_9BURK|nr:Diguanylate cyclase (GGDEF) domain-containing protein [Paraburkholderia dioscoreae]
MPAVLAGASLVCLLVGLLYLALQIRAIFSDQLKQEYAGLVLEAAGRADRARAMVDAGRQSSGDREAQVRSYRQARAELAGRLGSLAALVNASPAAAPHVPASALMPDASLSGTDALLATVSAYWRAQRDADGADVRLRIAHVANVLIALAALLFCLLFTALGMYAKRNRQLAGESHEFEYAALHDPMTGLPNRRKLFASLDEAAAKLQAGSAHRKIAVLYVDLDGFKQVNDSLGHQAGDEFLIAVSRRFRESVRKADVVARIGGDEFAVLIQEFSAADELAEIARRLIACVVATDRQMGLGLVRASIGIASFPDLVDDYQRLVAAADDAMYRVKRGGKNGYGFAARAN